MREEPDQLGGNANFTCDRQMPGRLQWLSMTSWVSFTCDRQMPGRL